MSPVMEAPMAARGRAASGVQRRPAEPARILLVAEGSGGHLIPALEVSQALAASGERVLVLYAQRPQVASLLDGLLQDINQTRLQLRPFSLAPCPLAAARGLWRLWQSRTVWQIACECLRTFHPQVVVGFGGWLSVPVILAARQQQIPTLLHEQNVRLGRANRFLLDWADQIALSFAESRDDVTGSPAVITGLPIRRSIGTASREQAAQRFGLRADALTVLILGGSQGSRALNRLVEELLPELSMAERQSWQFIHLAGAEDAPTVTHAYEALGLRAWVTAHLTDVAAAYALADVVVARAGASTVVELAQCGKPAVLIPYPHAAGHQLANARLVESAGAGIVLEEHLASPERLLSPLRQLLRDQRLRWIMGTQMHTLACPDSTHRLARAILTLAATSHWN